jgi:hypothetical protein
VVCKGRRAHCGGTHTAPGSGPPSMAPSSSAPAPASPTLSTHLPEGDVHPPRYVIICSCHPSCVYPISLEHSNRYKSVAFFFCTWYSTYGYIAFIILHTMYAVCSSFQITISMYRMPHFFSRNTQESYVTLYKNETKEVQGPAH